MNQDAQFFTENQQAMQEQYSAFAMPKTAKPAAPASIAEESRGPKESPLDNIDSPTTTFGNCRFVMSSFELYETKTRYYLVGTNQAKQRYRVLQIHRSNPKDLVVIEDDVLYTESEKNDLLKMLQHGNAATGGWNKVPLTIYGIVGFIRFTQGWYIIFITDRKQVAVLGGHSIYHIEETQLRPLGQPTKMDKNSDEARYLTTFQSIDMKRNFYFSYTYDITNTLQVNMNNLTTGESPDQQGNPCFCRDYNDMFMWNHYLLKSGFKNLTSRSGWILPLIYGFVDQAKIFVFGRNIMVTLIARRSRYFAGARFLKRGVNDKGYVANDVESEQIVAEMTTTSFHSTDKLFGNPRYTSYVQHRGSIPLIWSQDPTNISPKPPIELNVIDPFYSAAALHFENLFNRYGTPVIVLNLIKQKESAKRESILGKEFADAIEYLNQFLPDEHKIKYLAWDMSRASKSHDQDVIGYLENFAQETIETTGFFHSGPEPWINAERRNPKQPNQRRTRSWQNGVLRTNCIDCLDRTNAAQFLMGKCALGHQLYALGVVSSPKIDFDSDIVNIFTEMYHDHGDTIALQYGGSHLVNTVATYRKINQWKSHPRDTLEAMKRFYANTFSDADKQDTINLFLGNFVPKAGEPMIWELNSDYQLHNQNPRVPATRRDYRKWFSPDVLNAKQKEQDRPLVDIPKELQLSTSPIDESDIYRGYWIEYYNPKEYTTLDVLFTYTMNGSLKYRQPDIPKSRLSEIAKDSTELTKEEVQEMSPFTVRASTAGRTVPAAGTAADAKGHNPEEEDEEAEKLSEKPGLWTIESIAERSLDPHVAESEQEEYRRYTHQFRNIDRLQSDSTNKDAFPEYKHYHNYIERSETPDGLQTQAIDEQVYQTYVDIPRRVAAAQVNRELSSNARKRYDGYAYYLKHGRYPYHSSSSVQQRQFIQSLQNNALGAMAMAANSIVAAVVGQHKE